MTTPENLEIIFENEDFLAVNKPVKLASHQLPQSDILSVEALINKTRSGSAPILPAHRLDFDTSGVLLFAKSQENYESIRLLFRERRIQKFYLSHHTCNERIEAKLNSLKLPYEIQAPIAHHPKNKKKMVLLDELRLKTARFRGPILNAHTTLLDFQKIDSSTLRFSWQLHTGYTHQIRLHSVYLGAPIFGDPLYGPSESEIQRMWLHSKELRFMWKGQEITISAPLPFLK